MGTNKNFEISFERHGETLVCWTKRNGASELFGRRVCADDREEAMWRHACVTFLRCDPMTRHDNLKVPYCGPSHPCWKPNDSDYLASVFASDGRPALAFA
jgi:hypothetical protein